MSVDADRFFTDAPCRRTRLIPGNCHGLPTAAAILLGAVIVPTEPVLAPEVQLAGPTTSPMHWGGSPICCSCSHRPNDAGSSFARSGCGHPCHMAYDFRIDDTVEWNWGDETGKIIERFTSEVTRTIDGTEVEQNASEDEPAYLIDQEDGQHVLKSSTELT